VLSQDSRRESSGPFTLSLLLCCWLGPERWSCGSWVYSMTLACAGPV
jgi:hypothetical protein